MGYGKISTRFEMNIAQKRREQDDEKSYRILTRSSGKREFL